jgi:hypothetical protein
MAVSGFTGAAAITVALASLMGLHSTFLGVAAPHGYRAWVLNCSSESDFSGPVIAYGHANRVVAVDYMLPPHDTLSVC